MAGTEPVRLVPGGGTGRPLGVALAVVTVLVLGLLKPWGSGPSDRAQPSPAPIAGRATELAGPRSTPAGGPAADAPSASPDTSSNTSGPCYYGLAWRLFTAATSDVGPVHSWYGLQPIEASGPTDPRIAAVEVHSSAIGQLGYCSVTHPGLIRVVATQAWRLVPGRQPEQLVLEPVRESAPGSVLPAPGAGAIYTAPGTPTWAQAVYVFAVTLATTPATEEWFAVDIS